MLATRCELRCAGECFWDAVTINLETDLREHAERKELRQPPRMRLEHALACAREDERDHALRKHVDHNVVHVNRPPPPLGTR